MIEKLKKITSTHWLLIFGILFAFIGGHWSGDSSLVSHLGLTSSVVSIVLAIIAIFYTIEKRSSTEEQIGRMNGILHNVEIASGRLEKRGEAVHKIAQSLRDAQSTEKTKDDKDKPAKKSIEQVKLPSGLEEQLSTTSSYGLVCLNWIVKAKSSKKASSLKIIQEKLGADESDVDYLQGYCLGTGVNLAELNIIADDDTLMAEVIPDGFEELLQKTIKERLKNYSEKKNLKNRDRLNYQLELTNKYFSDTK